MSLKHHPLYGYSCLYNDRRKYRRAKKRLNGFALYQTYSARRSEEGANLKYFEENGYKMFFCLKD